MTAVRQSKPSGVSSLVARHEWLLPVVVSVTLAVFTFSVAVSLYPRPPILRDALGYTMAAQRLVDHGVFAYGNDDTPNASITPGYVLFLAGIYGALPRSADATASALAVRPAVQNTQFMLALSIVALVAGCGFSLGGRKLAYLSGFLAALYLPFAWGVTVALSEGLAATFAAVQLLLALLITRKGSQHVVALAAGLGAVSAILALVRPVTAAWIAVPFAFLAVRRTLSWRQLGRLSVLAISVFVLVMGGWWVRNAVTLHRFVALSEGAGNPAFESTGGGPLTPEEEAVAAAADKAGKDWQAAVAYYRMSGQLRADPLGIIGSRAAREFGVVREPWLVPVEVVWEQVNEPQIARIGPDSFPRGVPQSLKRVARASMTYHVFLLLAALCSLAFWRRSPRLLLVASVPVYFLLMHFFTYFISRYFFPAMPAVIVLAAAGVFGIAHSVVRLARAYVPGLDARA